MVTVPPIYSRTRENVGLQSAWLLACKNYGDCTSDIQSDKRECRITEVSLYTQHVGPAVWTIATV